MWVYHPLISARLARICRARRGRADRLDGRRPDADAQARRRRRRRPLLQRPAPLRTDLSPAAISSRVIGCPLEPIGSTGAAAWLDLARSDQGLALAALGRGRRMLAALVGDAPPPARPGGASSCRSSASARCGSTTQLGHALAWPRICGRSPGSSCSPGRVDAPAADAQARSRRRRRRQLQTTRLFAGSSGIDPRCAGQLVSPSSESRVRRVPGGRRRGGRCPRGPS